MAKSIASFTPFARSPVTHTPHTQAHVKVRVLGLGMYVHDVQSYLAEVDGRTWDPQDAFSGSFVGSFSLA